MTDIDTPRARLVGINHVALEVGDLDAALDFYSSIFEFDLRGQTESALFLDMGDQFLALTEAEEPLATRDTHRHVGLVVDDPTIVERRLDERDVERISTRGLDFHDPWGNRLQVVAYEDIQFTKTEHVLRGMGFSGLAKTDAALSELANKGMQPE